MGERESTVVTEEPAEEFFDPAMAELDGEEFESLDFAEAVTEKALKAATVSYTHLTLPTILLV